MDYQEFLLGKLARPEASGFEATDLPEALKPWQAAIVRWACKLGRAAIFAGCGLGKTLMGSLSWADQVTRMRKPRPLLAREEGEVYDDFPLPKAGDPINSVLVLTPPAVAHQTVREGSKFGVKVRHVLRSSELDGPGIYATNYQRLHLFDGIDFAGVVLDESSILKSYMGATKRALVERFADTPYRLCCTATPSPNDHTELGNHAEFLGIMSSSEMLSRWFINDQAHTGEYRLKGHAEEDFWRWVASWAVCLDKPSDLGQQYADDEGEYILPPIDYRECVVGVDRAERDWREAGGQTLIVPPDQLTATTMHAEMRLTATSRARRAAEIVCSEDSPCVVWCNTNYEADALREVLPDAVDLRGGEKDDAKETKLVAFTEGKIKVLITKPSVAGFGLNWQHCPRCVFVGLSYSHEQFYQAIRRIWRFGQEKTVQVHVVIADTEGEVLAAIRSKEGSHNEMRDAMRKATREAMARDDAARTLRTVKPSVVAGDNWTLHHGDCVEVARTLPDASVDLTVFSPPFSTLYIYSDALQDMGNSADDAEFWRHYTFLAPELLRITVPGRLCAVHCKDLPRYAGRDGTAGLKDFPGHLIQVMEGAGWSYHSRVTIWKCPVVERERTNNNGLLHKTVKRDSTQIRQGMADYLIVFRRPPAEGLMSDKPIVRPNGIERYIGEDDVTNFSREKLRHPSPFARDSSADRNLAIWQRYAEGTWWDVTRLTPNQFRAVQLLMQCGMSEVEIADALGLADTEAVWFDIDQMDVLNHRIATADRDEKHICPLQLGLIRRVVDLWSQPGEVVFSPFAGVGSEGVVSLQERRKFVGIELKESYHRIACGHLANATKQGDLFNFQPTEAA